MKTQFISGMAVCVVLAGSVMADDLNQRRPVGSDHRSPVVTRGELEHLGHLVKMSDLLGDSVRDASGEKIGTVDEVAVDVGSGRILEVVVSTGSFLKLGGRSISVPPQLFRVEHERGVRLNVDRGQLRGAPEVRLAKWDPDWDDNRLNRIYSYYGQAPTYFDERDWKGPRDARRDHYVERASRLVGKNVEDRRGDKLGNIEDLIVDLPSGRAVFAVVSTGGFLGLGDELSAVPLTVLRHAEDHNHHGAILFDASRDRLSQAPHFKKSQWPQWDEDYAGRIYHAHEVEPYFYTRPTGRDDSHDFERGRDRNAVRVDEGVTPADIAITRHIRQDITAQKRLATSARDVEITTVNGRVIVRGTVDSNDDRKAIGEIVKRNSNGPVDNQLEVRGKGR